VLDRLELPQHLEPRLGGETVDRRDERAQLEAAGVAQARDELLDVRGARLEQRDAVSRRRGLRGEAGDRRADAVEGAHGGRTSWLRVVGIALFGA
jgi:hypothetical protein